MCNIFRKSEYLLYQRIAYPIFLYVPTIGITVICCFMIVMVRKRSKKIAETQKEKKQKRKGKKAVIQLVLIIIAFLIGYIPFTGRLVLVNQTYFQL